MSLLSSALKGKGVQSTFCSLCSPASSTPASRSFSSSNIQFEVSRAELERRKTVGQALLQQDAQKREEERLSPRSSKLKTLTSTMKGIAKDGVQPGSVIAEQQQPTTPQGRRQELPAGKVMHAKELRKEMMWPALAYRRTTAMEALGPRKSKALKTDYFLNIPTVDKQGINPLNEYLNPQLLSHFVTNMGKIMPRARTQLTWKNQRRLGKAVRRARAMGLMPYFGDWSSSTVKEAKFRKWGMPQTGRS